MSEEIEGLEAEGKRQGEKVGAYVVGFLKGVLPAVLSIGSVLMVAKEATDMADLDGQVDRYFSREEAREAIERLKQEKRRQSSGE